ncbi:FusB/FusC family EF-G-binding protein [Bacillus sp. FJAT-49736]|uniref:FusB/FusC family EF-G-binding protein n=1 Tax=Bacillus sp. FJAT-49736 TaxID=2833582 RepID=UPI001BC9382A|nr:FusB/FusC family EF-G-binding protein [Bacillus sp. FJAT-49736]MBS4172678.1 FusB/FusC family EF-G-binding protein [Bacillus sp. FJAT-49736]
MELFIRADQYQFIKLQTQILINGHSSVNDRKVLNALKSLTYDKVMNVFSDLSMEQKQLLEQISDVEDSQLAEAFIGKIKPYVIPFKEVTEQTVKKLFPKAKKLKLPALDGVDFKEISYLGWDDKGSNKKYLIAPLNHKLIGLHGNFTSSSKKGVCVLCQRHSEIGLFMSEIKGKVQGTYTRRGNYICQDSIKCNENLTSLSKLEEFITLLKG